MVAVGAAIQAGVLQGDVKDVLLLDVTPLSLGLETQGGVMTPLIPRNTTIPTRKAETFTTAADNQSQVEVHVLQGERPLASENKSLARFTLDGILPAPRGMPQIEVAFDTDANGILHVSAKDKATGKEQRVEIQPSSGLSDAEVKRMVRDAEQHAAEDTRRRQDVELRNRADHLVYTAERQVRESGDTMPSDIKVEIEEQVQAIRRGLQHDDLNAARAAMEVLERAMQRAGQAAYATAAAGTSSSGGSQGGAPGTVEGDYREV